MAITYPTNCDTPRRKTELLYNAQEDLRLLHNVFSKWLHEGLTVEEYRKLPKKFQGKYPYIVKLLKADWNRFQKEDFTPRSNKICQGIGAQRAELKKSGQWSIDIGDI